MNPHALLVPTIIIAIITYTSAFEKGQPTCDAYILNTYLYSITYLFMLFYIIQVLSTYYPKFLLKLDMLKFFGAIIINLALLFITYKVPKNNVLLKHILSFAYIASASFLLSLVFIYFDSKAINSAILLSIILFIVLSVVAHNFKHLISSRVSLAFFVVFVLMVIAELIIGIFYPSSWLEKAIITVVLMIICYLVLVKTKRMIENGDNCVKNNGPDYVNESISFLVSFQNILLRILQLRRGRRMKI